MPHMHFNPDLPPETRKSPNPEENKRNDILVQAKLMDRSPGGELEWVERHAAAFRQLFNTDDAFRDLVNGEMDDETLSRIQERLHEAEKN